MPPSSSLKLAEEIVSRIEQVAFDSLTPMPRFPDSWDHDKIRTMVALIIPEDREVLDKEISELLGAKCSSPKPSLIDELRDLLGIGDAPVGTTLKMAIKEIKKLRGER